MKRASLIITWLAAVVILALAAGHVGAQESARENGTVTIEYIAHACFRVTSPSGKQVLIDPYASRVWLGYDFPPSVRADAVLISHPHYDHDGGEAMRLPVPWPPKTLVLRRPGTNQIGDDLVAIGFAGKHADPWGKEFGQSNTIWLLQVAGLRIVHLGDNGPLRDETIREIGRVDVLMIPIDSQFHILKADQIATIRRQLSPPILIPMHYRHDDLETDPGKPEQLGGIEQWAKGAADVRYLAAHKLELSFAALPTKPEVFIFKHSPLVTAPLKATVTKGAHHYVFFNRDRERISDAAFLGATAFEGAQLKYTWRELEQGKDGYDFSAIQHDLMFLTSKGKKLFIQLQDTSFDPAIVNVPRYLMNDARYNGGADQQYSIKDDDEERAVPEGWVARRWDPAVQERFHKLLLALGKEFDGKIQGINLPETAVEFGETGRLFPKGFTPSIYRDATVTNMLVLKHAFPNSVAMQYTNFMPGEWLPGKDQSYLRSVYQRAKEMKVGVGGPDLLPYQTGQMNHCYPLIRECAGKIPTGIAVQEGNYQHKKPNSPQPVTISELIGFATEHLKVDYIFWCTQEPFYSQKLIPFLQEQR